VATQRWDPDEYGRTAAFVPELGLPVLDLLAPQPGECILDLGCGDGVLTARLAEMGATVVGVDASEAMVAAARARGLDARVVDGRRLSFVEEFDAVFSNAALHWMGDLAGVCRGTFRALRPGGRFVGELGAAGNVAAVVDAIGTGLRARGIDPDALNPWVFPTAGEFGALLEGAGLQVSRLETIERPTPLPGDIVEWLGTFAGCFLDALESRVRRNFEQELRDILAPRLRSPDGIWCVDYVRLRFAATKPE
jgi:trans-aconitate methyltransferase